MSDRHFLLRFPFRLAPGIKISGFEKPVELTRNDLTIRLSKEGSFYLLTIEGFPDEQSATNFLNNTYSGLMWNLIQQGKAFSAEFETQKVRYIADPIVAAQNLSKTWGIEIKDGVDGLIDGSFPAVYRNDKRIRKLTVGDSTLTISSDANKFLESFVEIALSESILNVEEESQLNTALDLYSISYYQSTTLGKFLTLVIVLEALLPNTARSESARNMIEDWDKQLDEKLNRLDKASEDYEVLKNLKQELRHKKYESIRRRIRNLVIDSVSTAETPTESELELAKEAVKAYDLRSTILHTGKIDKKTLTATYGQLSNIVKMVLETKFREYQKALQQVGI